jgi:DNA-binding response OmpR family regulator
MRKSALVVAVDADPRITGTIRDELLPDGIRVESGCTGREGLQMCCSMQPDCMVIDLGLPDMDGVSLAEAIRSQPAMTVATTPIVLLSSRHDETTRIRALCGGVDVIVGKPFQGVELSAQVRAVLKMAQRLRNRRSSMGVGPPSEKSSPHSALAGDLRKMSIATVLGALELERRSGELCLSDTVSGAVRLRLSIASGLIAGGQMDSCTMTPIDSLREALRWHGRRFEFLPGEDRPAPPGAEPLGTLVLAVFKHGPPPPMVPPAGNEANLNWNDSVLPGVPAQLLPRPPGLAPARPSSTHRKAAPPPASAPETQREGERPSGPCRAKKSSRNG